MRITLTASTGAKIFVWREEDMFHARLANGSDDVQICLGIDLFEVIAELAGLDLEQERQAQEAIRLSERAQQQLAQQRADG
jgi:hypothetical protein